MFGVTSSRITLHTFRDAAESYVANGGEGKYLPPIVALIGERPLIELFPFDIRKTVETLFPTQSGATRNRQGLTPIRSVMIHAYDRGWAPLLRLSKFKEDKPARKKPATIVWLHCFISQADRDGLAHLGSLVMFMATTGARVSEAVELCWREVDMVARTAVLLRTKTETNSVRYLTDEMTARLMPFLATRKAEERVFGYGSRFSVNERIKVVCWRAGIPYKSSHVCGRHAFATNAIAMGADPASTMEAGGWKSSQIFLETYVNPRQAGRKVAELFNRQAYETGL